MEVEAIFPARHLPPVILHYQCPERVITGHTHTHTLTFDLAESLVGESVGKREERGTS